MGGEGDEEKEEEEEEEEEAEILMCLWADNPGFAASLGTSLQGNMSDTQTMVMLQEVLPGVSGLDSDSPRGFFLSGGLAACRAIPLGFDLSRLKRLLAFFYGCFGVRFCTTHRAFPTSKPFPRISCSDAGSADR